MKFQRNTALAGVALFVCSGVALAGPCTEQITRHQAAYDARLNAVAAAGPTADESTQATLHRQPTPNSVAHAEANLGDLSQSQADAFADAMTRARAADEAGNLKACEKALDDGSAALRNP